MKQSWKITFFIAILFSSLLPQVAFSEELPKQIRLDPFSLLSDDEVESEELSPQKSELDLLNIDLDELLKDDDKPVSKPRITILKVVDYRENNQLKIDSQSRITLGPEQIEAINHGIPLKFKTEILLTEQTSLFGIPYQRTRKHVEYITELTSFGQRIEYALFNNRNDKLRRFATIERAMETLGTLESFEVAQLKELHPTQKYRLRMRIFLDYWKLPTPMFVDALLDDSWRINSGWFEVNLTTPLSWQ